MNYNYELQLEIEFSSEEKSLLRTAVFQEYNEVKFKVFPEKLDFEDIEYLIDILESTIEWNDFDDNDMESAMELYFKLEDLETEFLKLKNEVKQ